MLTIPLFTFICKTSQIELLLVWVVRFGIDSRDKFNDLYYLIFLRDRERPHATLRDQVIVVYLRYKFTPTPYKVNSTFTDVIKINMENITSLYNE